MVADPLEAKRLGISDQLTEDPVTAWRGADARSGRLVDADEQESLELLLFRIEDAQRRIARSGEIACHLEHLPQDGFEVELETSPRPTSSSRLSWSRSSSFTDRPANRGLRLSGSYGLVSGGRHRCRSPPSALGWPKRTNEAATCRHRAFLPTWNRGGA